MGTFTWERRYNRVAGTAIILSTIFVLMLVLGEFLSRSDRILIWLIAVNITVVLSFQLYTGNSGKFSLAHPAFMGLGAYVGALFTVPPLIARSVQRDAPSWLQATELDPAFAIVIGAFASLIAAWLIGYVIVRLNFDGVVISTWSILIISQAMIIAMRGWTNGATSLFGLPLIDTPWLIGATGIATVAFCAFYKESRQGATVARRAR